ncbi:MAG: hypothetical protein WA177_13460 [Xanthobacteraceae bacterium]
MRNRRLAIAAAAALGIATMGTSAMALPHGGGGGGHFGGGHMGGSNFGGGHLGIPGAGAMAAPNVGTLHANVGAPNVAANVHMGHGYGHGYNHYAYRGHGYGLGGLYAFGGPDYYDYDYGDSCYQRRWVPTPFGWRWRRVWACD